MIKVSKLTVADLQVYVSDAALAERDVVPISRQRALSYTANPRADSNDIVMYLAYHGDALVGYRTILPDLLFIDERPVKVGWMSGSWVDPKYRRKGISLMLLEETLRDWNSKLLFTNYSPLAKMVFDKSDQFDIIYKAKGQRFYLKPCLYSLLPPRRRIFRNLKWALYAIDRLLQLFNPMALNAKFMTLGKNVTLEYFNRPDEEISDLFETINYGTPTRRSRFELQWILRFPWLVASPLGDRIGKKYFFSSSPKRFNQYLLKVFNNDNLVGCLLISEHGNRLTVPYAWFDSNHTKIVAHVILLHAARLKSAMLTIYNNALIDAIKGMGLYRLFSKQHVRSYFATRELCRELKGQLLRFNDGEGDCAFV
jgi:GNAT superfamily N-acetyltransferase